MNTIYIAWNALYNKVKSCLLYTSKLVDEDQAVALFHLAGGGADQVGAAPAGVADEVHTVGHRFLHPVSYTHLTGLTGLGVRIKLLSRGTAVK